ncbi:alpha/beta hydrolase [Jhaorihella thermophila]|uniref:Esterase/lipase superfamily enzyme n=1 Tax=Jhaorihella thermophila TaxID=488547 RepID=A0A1H5VRT3_9RHOB|nr:alpha/beta hydrolase [Jhaorihella thermophila]SEF89541.1 Esterase/lipase superfamily enzyme [Jhaorihella thermophila]
MRALMVFVLFLGLGACENKSYTPVLPQALSIGEPETVFVATTRAREADGGFSYRRSQTATTMALTISVPPDHEPGNADFGFANPDPAHEFSVAARREFDTDRAFQNALRAELRRLPPGQRDVTVYVHGYNATLYEASYRAAQIGHDLDLPGAQAVYSWPSLGSVTGYAYDTDSVLFARDGLEHMLRLIDQVGPDNLVIVAHSMGSLLVMETLRQADLRQPGWSARSIDGVMFVSPDLDIDVFRSQLAALKAPPQPMVVVASRKDPVLLLSSALRGGSERDRLGNIANFDEVSDLPIVLLDVSAFATLTTNPHFVAAASPALVRLLNQAAKVAKTMDVVRLQDVLPGTVVKGSRAVAITLDSPV